MIVEKRPFDEAIFYPESDQEKALLGSDKVEATSYDIFYARLYRDTIPMYFSDRKRYDRFMKSHFNEQRIKLSRMLMAIGEYLYYSHQDRVLKFSGLPYPRENNERI
jgi:hypothetical protein